MRNKRIGKIITSFLSLTLLVGFFGNSVLGDWLKVSDKVGAEGIKYNKTELKVNVKYAEDFIRENKPHPWRYGFDAKMNHGSAIFDVTDSTNNKYLSYGMCVADQHNDPTQTKGDVYIVDYSNLTKKGTNSVIRGASQNLGSSSSTVWNKALLESDLYKYSDEQIIRKILHMLYYGDWTYYELQKGITIDDLPSRHDYNRTDYGIKIDKKKAHKVSDFANARDLIITDKVLEMDDDYKKLFNGNNSIDNECFSGLFCACHSIISYVMTGEEFNFFSTVFCSYPRWDDTYVYDGKKSKWAFGSDGQGKDAALYREMYLVQLFNIIAMQPEYKMDAYIYVPTKWDSSSPNSGSDKTAQWVLFAAPVMEEALLTFKASKIDLNGNGMSGASFSFYSDKKCENKIGSMNETESGSSVYKSDVFKIGFDSKGEIDVDLYLKESKKPNKIVTSSGNVSLDPGQDLSDKDIYKINIKLDETRTLQAKITDLNSGKTYSQEISNYDYKTGKQAVIIRNNDNGNFLEGKGVSITKQTDNANIDNTVFMLYEQDRKKGGDYNASFDTELAVYKKKDNKWSWYVGDVPVGKYFPVESGKFYGIRETYDPEENRYQDTEILYDIENYTAGWKPSSYRNSYYMDFEVSDKDLAFTAKNNRMMGSLDAEKEAQGGFDPSSTGFVLYRDSNGNGQRDEHEIFMGYGKTDSKGNVSWSYEKDGKYTDVLNELPLGYYTLIEYWNDDLYEFKDGNKIRFRTKNTGDDWNALVEGISVDGVRYQNAYYTGLLIEDSKKTVVNAVNKKTSANIRVIKRSDDGKVSGIKFNVWYIDGNSRYLADTVSTDKSGTAVLRNIPLGTYEIEEKTGNKNYKSVWTGKVNDDNNAVIELYTDGETAERKIENHINVSLTVNKTDEWTGDKIKDTVSFDLYKDSNSNGKIDPEESKAIMTLSDKDKDGTVSFDNIPKGNYILKEIKNPKGYILSSESLNFKVDEAKDIKKDFNNTPANARIRILKKDYDDNTFYLSGAYFEIFEDSDKNGVYTEGSDKEACFKKEKVYIKEQKDKAGNPYYSTVTKENKEAFLRYGRYFIVEKIAPFNHYIEDGKAVTTVDIPDTSNGNEIVIDVSNRQKVETEIDKKTDSEGKTLNDVVRYTNLIAGKDYKIKGELVDPKTGLSSGIKSEVSFKPEAAPGSEKLIDGSIRVSGSVKVPFIHDFNGIEEKYESLVAFEEIYDSDNMLIGYHKDINDLGQKIVFSKKHPEIKTKAALVTHTRIEDTVTYKDLVKGREYKLLGRIIDKNTGEDMNIVSETVFKAEKESGKVKVVFELPSEIFKAETLVIYEELYYGKELIAEHKDSDDKDQTVDLPGIATTAADTETKSHVCSLKADCEINDKIEYHDLIAGLTYKIKGSIVRKDDPESVIATAEKEYIPESKDGSIDLTFKADTRMLKDKTLVVFEELYEKDIKICEHR
ncbi:MAG: VaFE repeat-containing surface-anchored protein, partial [Clostridiales bacterium]|nr:VaFE repeat-containing surface-anchored protein [Clostridiales bacterium]